MSASCTTQLTPQNKSIEICQIPFLSFLAVIFMKTPSSLWENLLSSSYLSCTHCKYAVSRNHSSELAQTLFKSSSVPHSESWVDMCNGLLNDVVLVYCCSACWCGKRECVVRTCWMVWLMMSSETAKTACVDVGGRVWWLKWAVRQGRCAHACVWVRKRCGEQKRKTGEFSDTFLPVGCSSLNGATQIQEFPDLKGTTSLEILWVSPLTFQLQRMWKDMEMEDSVILGERVLEWGTVEKHGEEQDRDVPER